MTDPQPSVGGTLKDLFPGLHTPGQEALESFYTSGIVALDTNALFDVYRLTGDARKQFLDALALLGERLWIPHRVGNEFMQTRPTVIRDCHAETANLALKVGATVAELRRMIEYFATRRGLKETAEYPELLEVFQDAQNRFVSLLEATTNEAVPVREGTSPDDDPIYLQISALIADKIGQPLPDTAAAIDEVFRRYEKNIPPGTADKKKRDRVDQAGDGLIWLQLIEHAKEQQKPILLITRDSKPDWVRPLVTPKDDADPAEMPSAPRTELIEEMRDKTGQPFHLVDPRTFLMHAERYLEAVVDAGTVRQAEHLNEASGSEGEEGDDDEEEDDREGHFEDARSRVAQVSRSPIEDILRGTAIGHGEVPMPSVAAKLGADFAALWQPPITPDLAHLARVLDPPLQLNPALFELGLSPKLQAALAELGPYPEVRAALDRLSGHPSARSALDAAKADLFRAARTKVEIPELSPTTYEARAEQLRRLVDAGGEQAPPEIESDQTVVLKSETNQRKPKRRRR
ncbi:PIN-like domain-containing protein [Actinocorallia aurea]